MTVEQVIERLQREYPQSRVMVEVTGSQGRAHWDDCRGSFVLNPYDVRPDSRNGLVIILCDQADC